MKKKRSFFEKLTGGVKAEDEFEDFDGEHEDHDSVMTSSQERQFDDKIDGELSVDVINAPSDIVIRAMVAGVKPQDLDIQISRDMVSIHGTREESSEVSNGDYYHRELYWGSFSRNILLPEEVDVELADAKERHGLLEIRLPKIDKDRKTKLSVKSS